MTHRDLSNLSPPPRFNSFWRLHERRYNPNKTRRVMQWYQANRLLREIKAITLR